MTDGTQEDIVTENLANDSQDADNVEGLRSRLEAAQEEAAANYDRFLRARADMENFRKRIERTYADNLRDAKKDLLRKLLGVQDNLQRALQYGEGATQGESLMEGVRLTAYQLEQLLDNEGVKPIDAVGQPFDPRLEEAVHRVNDPNVPDHTVVQEARRGYTFGDDVLRPAQVVVSVHGDDD